MQIGRKLYYELSTGIVLLDMGERSGSVIETTEQEDYASYAVLAERVPSTIGVMKLEYFEFSQDFAECNGVMVNLDTGELEFSYPDPSYPEAIPTYKQPLSVEVTDLKQSKADQDEIIMNILLGGS